MARYRHASPRGAAQRHQPRGFDVREVAGDEQSDEPQHQGDAVEKDGARAGVRHGGSIRRNRGHLQVDTPGTLSVPMAALLSPIALASSRPPRAERRGGYFVQTWGCQMNEEDSEQMGLFLEGMGYHPAESSREADVILLNTCSVRQKPEDKAFSMLGEIAILKRARPDLIVGVCGCMAQLRAEEIHRRAPHVDFVVGTGHIAEIPALVQEALDARRFATRLDLPERRGAVVEEMPRREVGRTAKLKSFVPIQYGCDKFCTFCIVPTTRGRERSRPTAEILAEVRALAENGTREVTLLGQTVNSYGKNMPEGKVPFSELLRLVASVPS
ncbi:radical SAM protein, partial [bacterium]